MAATSQLLLTEHLRVIVAVTGIADRVRRARLAKREAMHNRHRMPVRLPSKAKKVLQARSSMRTMSQTSTSLTTLHRRSAHRRVARAKARVPVAPADLAVVDAVAVVVARVDLVAAAVVVTAANL